MSEVGLRPDFARLVNQALRPGQELAEHTMAKLNRGQRASEDFEAMCVKNLLDVARRSSLSQEESAVSDFARDMLNNGIAQAVSRRQPGLGIASLVFQKTAQALIAQDESSQSRTENHP
ncbi:MAG: hypothetical protein IT207_02445 [Fimbriimonadaceae bacterium]|nr:hypothetical protein [Fimbriimonadaceae bacterium]